MTKIVETWDKSQLKVIQAPKSERCIIDAGPGTGKTAVSCARVAWLISEGVAPGNIWVVSFTRTAVREIRDRIHSYVGNGGDANSVKIATLDSHAWAIHYGFDETPKIFSSYDENIEVMTGMVRSDPSVIDYLESSFEYLIIDEAQDIVGIRADLILEIIKKLPLSCGVSVFADEAQAIYGWSLEDDEPSSYDAVQLTLPQKIRESKQNEFREYGLSTVFRTSDPNLKTLFTDTRKKVLEEDPDVKLKHKKIKKEIRGLAHYSISGKIQDHEIQNPNKSFILYRRRADVHYAASFFGTNPHRIRMSGLPVCLHSWIGACLSEYTKRTIGKSDFVSLWKRNFDNSEKGLRNADMMWNHLIRHAGRSDKIVNMGNLQQVLGRKQPPSEFCYSEIGFRGPIIGTIHASKGRETDEVCLLIPENHGHKLDDDEETRVVFVGATRAKSLLHVGSGFATLHAKRLPVSGRAYTLLCNQGSPTAQVEIGRDGDITASGITGTSHYSSIDDVRKKQELILSLRGKITPAYAVSDHGSGHIYRLKSGEFSYGKDVCCLSQSVNSDLFEVGKEIHTILGGGKRRPPDELRYLRIYGTRTLVLPPDSSERGKLFEPWSESGIMLAPVVLGYPKAFFKYY
ncbi:UvrD-helicase domain-containing protein [Methanolacinia paynteri]|uniref:UvrD-helicase domain-containing protein n=1 Tax=Methanolacinia paynteri TaxID=230356 RepID=UPI00064F9E1B|nr:UvrD-helicase domain-containing protein [Methanolacinia paynteri]